MATNVPYKIMNAANVNYVLDCKYVPENEASIHVHHGQ